MLESAACLCDCHTNMHSRLFKNIFLTIPTTHAYLLRSILIQIFQTLIKVIFNGRLMATGCEMNSLVPALIASFAAYWIHGSSDVRNNPLIQGRNPNTKPATGRADFDFSVLPAYFNNLK